MPVLKARIGGAWVPIPALTADDSITNAKLANMPAGTVKGNKNLFNPGDPTDITRSEFAVMMGGYLGRVYVNTNIGGATTQVVTHNLNIWYCQVQVITQGPPFDTVECDVQRVDPNSIRLTFDVAPAAAAYVCTVIG